MVCGGKVLWWEMRFTLSCQVAVVKLLGLVTQLRAHSLLVATFHLGWPEWLWKELINCPHVPVSALFLLSYDSCNEMARILSMHWLSYQLSVCLELLRPMHFSALCCIVHCCSISKIYLSFLINLRNCYVVFFLLCVCKMSRSCWIELNTWVTISQFNGFKCVAVAVIGRLRVTTTRVMRSGDTVS